ncbi:hypothetical protein ACGC1H_005555 [Rhizoctonia solani]|uniref:Ricin B lectin domain-containing protein n=1 Tax=Rhizoctonia solani TaxID=456999 RepID=A0A8H3GGF9_9AGAM|nr:unnamed protein product [Rhizoctonia solani]
MHFSPGTYTIRDTDSGRAIDYYGGQTRIGTWDYHCGENQKWRIKSYPGNLGYAIQNVMTNKYIPMKIDGSYMNGVDEGDAAIVNFEHQFRDFYLIKLIGTNVYLGHPYIELDGSYTPVSFIDKDTPQGCFWQLEKLNDDTGSMLRPRRNHSSIFSSEPQSNTSFQNPGSLYTDDAHLYTDMLFNMPRMPFTRDQRIAALDWARKLGATNVPTMESFDECERRLESRSNNN